MRLHGRSKRSFWKIVGAAILSAAALAGAGPGAGAAQSVPANDRAHGMVWDGLAPGRAENRCQGIFEIRGRADQVLGCTHGPDPAPKNVDVRTPVATDAIVQMTATLPSPTPGPGTNGNGIACSGDGTSGFRVEAIYATAGGTDRYSSIAPVIQTSYAPFMEWQYRTSAGETGGEVHLPFVTAADASGGCSVVVRHEVLSSTAADTFSNTISELQARGYNRTDRRYMVWMDANVLCGIGQIYRDSQSGQANANNGYYTAFGRVDNGCWGYGESHELMHNLGGVQPDAPHATPGFHCWDENDEMCYDDDGTGPVVMQSICPSRDGRLFDCNHDDYFLAGTPAAGTYLSTHWNTYNSRFLLRGPLGAPTNVAPTVNAGVDQSIQSGSSATLHGTVTDDGRPAGSPVTVAWAKAAGPGTVTFSGPTSVDSSASFSAAGSYTLSLTASDTQLSASDTMVVTVNDRNAPVTETFTGSFSKQKTSITHTFTAGIGAMTVTVKGPSNKSITTKLVAPGGATVAQMSGTGTRTMTWSVTAAGTYQIIVSGTSGSYTATVQHMP